MNFRKNQITSKSVKKSNTSKKELYSHNQRERIIISLMRKYDITLDEAEKILKQIEKKEVKQTGNSIKNNLNIPQEDKKLKQIHVKNQNLDKNSLQSISDMQINGKSNYGTELIKNSDHIHSNFEKTQIKKRKQHSQNVDEIMSEIIPNYDKDISIELKNVNLTFEIETDKVDTVKEYVIRKLKRTKTEKIKLEVLKNVSFKIYKGEKIGVIGYNGAGKSTLLKVICGIYPPDDGEVITHGNISPLLSLGLGFDRNYSGRKNIFLNGAVLGYYKDFLKQKEQEIIDFSELGKFIDIPIKNYSSGMTAKLGFAIATLVNPDILVIDEVLGVGDATFKRKSADKMNSLMDGRTTVVLVTHSIPQIRQSCDKAIWLHNGEILEIGEVNKVCDHYLKAAEKASNEEIANIQMR